MKKFLLTGSLSFFLFIAKLEAQSCFNVFAGNDTTISCLQSCLDLHARVPDVKTTDDYQAISIPYQPYPYTNPGGILVDPSYQDDKFSPAIPLPFTFCFYGQNYNSLVVGTNGVVTFDLSNAGLENGYLLVQPGGAPQPIFYAGGTQGGDGPYYPKASIMGPYHDIDPDSTSTPQQPGRKMEYIVTGSAPCRKFILNFYRIPYWHCPNAIVTQQMVLYEGTGIIDIFIESKPPDCGTSFNGGRAILGLQNWNRDMQVSVTGRNCTVWNAFDEGWRFVPNGGSSLLKRVELYKNGTLISTATTTPLGNGQVDAQFTNVCQSEDSMSYAVRAFYQQCDNPAIETEGSDTLIVYKTLNPLTVNTTDPICPAGNGQITVANPVAANIEYSIDNGVTWQSSPVFNSPAGSYTVIARVVGSNCKGSTPVTLTDPQPFSTNGVVADVKCKGQSTGQVVFSPVGDNPFTYSKDGGITYQASNTFTGLAAGPHTFRIKNGLGCTQDTTLIINEPATALNTFSSSTAATCPNNDGSITITANGGTPAYEYSIDGGITFQPGNVFNDLPSGNYGGLVVRDANGCTKGIGDIVALNDTMRLELGPDSTICFGSSITLLPQTNDLTDTFRWSPRAGLDFDTVKDPIATPNDTTKYFLLAKWGVCQREDSITINVLHKPIALAGNDTTICYKTFAILNGSVANISGPVSYAWTPAATVVPPNLPIAVATPDSTQQYVLEVKDNYGCNFTVTDTMWVIMEAPVPAFAGNDTNALLGKPHHMKATGGVSYEWTPAGPLNDPHIANPIAILYNDTYFRVWVTDAIGCKAFDDIFIKVYEGPQYYLPNAFTPNGDGLNDIFMPIPVGMKSTDYFMVYDRYGELLFQTREWMKGWDGRFKGKDAPMGTYVWIIRGKDENGNLMEKKGTVTLIR